MRSTRRPAPAFGPAGLPPLAGPPLLARVPLLVSVIAASSWANALVAPLLPGVARRIRKSIPRRPKRPLGYPSCVGQTFVKARENLEGNARMKVLAGAGSRWDGYCDAGAGAGTG